MMMRVQTAGVVLIGFTLNLIPLISLDRAAAETRPAPVVVQPVWHTPMLPMVGNAPLTPMAQVASCAPIPLLVVEGVQFLRDRILRDGTEGHMQDHVSARQDSQMQLRLHAIVRTDLHGLQGQLQMRVAGLVRYCSG